MCSVITPASLYLSHSICQSSEHIFQTSSKNTHPHRVDGFFGICTCIPLCQCVCMCIVYRCVISEWTRVDMPVWVIERERDGVREREKFCVCVCNDCACMCDGFFHLFLYIQNVRLERFMFQKRLSCRSLRWRTVATKLITCQSPR